MGSKGWGCNPIDFMSLKEREETLEICLSLFVSIWRKGHERAQHKAAVYKPGREVSPQTNPEAS